MDRNVEAVRFGPDGRTRLFVGFVAPNRCHVTFAISLIRLLMALKHRVTVVPMYSGPNISQPRNDLVEAFINTDCDFFLSVDSDVQFDPEHVDALLAHDLPIVGGVYRNQYEDHPEGPLPVGSILRDDGTSARLTPEVLGQTEGLVKVFGLGMGFTLIQREVLVALGSGALWPYAEVAIPGENGGPAHLLSEDITFCVRARNKGFDSWLDLDTTVTHFKESPIR